MEENSLIEKRFCSQRLDKIWEPETVKWVPKKLNEKKNKEKRMRHLFTFSKRANFNFESDHEENKVKP